MKTFRITIDESQEIDLQERAAASRLTPSRYSTVTRCSTPRARLETDTTLNYASGSGRSAT